MLNYLMDERGGSVSGAEGKCVHVSNAHFPFEVGVCQVAQKCLKLVYKMMDCIRQQFDVSSLTSIEIICWFCSFTLNFTSARVP